MVQSCGILDNDFEGENRMVTFLGITSSDLLYVQFFLLILIELLLYFIFKLLGMVSRFEKEKGNKHATK
jgi:hypothetical protein